MARRDHISSFRKGLDIIRSFEGVHRRQTITQAALRTGLTRASARRFLHTLCAEGLVHTDGKFFELTPAVLEIGRNYLCSMKELDVVREALFELTQEIGKPTAAATLHEADVFCVAQAADLDPGVTKAVGIGMRVPAYCTAVGHVLLTLLHPLALRHYLEVAKFERLTASTLTNATLLKARLALVRAQGYATVEDERAPRLRAISVAIPCRVATVNMAITVTSNNELVSSKELVRRYLPALRRTVSRVAGNLQ
jgi:IclR family transcriptional regulator, pca regulon regulatory protein